MQQGLEIDQFDDLIYKISDAYYHETRRDYFEDLNEDPLRVAYVFEDMAQRIGERNENDRPN